MKKLIQWVYVLFMGLATPTVILVLILGGYKFTPPTAAIMIILGTMGTVAAYTVFMAMHENTKHRIKYEIDPYKVEKSDSKVHLHPDKLKVYLVLDEEGKNADIIPL